jgi:hypothetical protein
MDITKTIAGGYTALTAGTLYQVLEAFSAKTITYQDFRLFFACAELRAIRECAYRNEKPKGKRFSNFKLSELEERVGGVGGEYLRRSLQRLRKAKLLDFSKAAIIINQTHPEDFQESFKHIFNRSPNRRIPTPRRILSYLSSCSKPSVSCTIIAYLLYGLSLRPGGTISSRGAVKSSLIAKVAGISLRAAKAARSILVSLGWLTKDTDSTQRKLNRTGAYFELNLNWSSISKSDGEIEPGTQAVEEAKEEAKTLSTAEFAPPQDLSTAEFAPPYKDLRTSKETLKTHKLDSGVSVKQGNLSPPKLQNVISQDLFQLERLETLYSQAREKGLIQQNQADKLNFVAAAVRAWKLRQQGNPVKIFMGLLRKKLWMNISQSDEDKARYWMLKHLETITDFGETRNYRSKLPSFSQ